MGHKLTTLYKSIIVDSDPSQIGKQPKDILYNEFSDASIAKAIKYMDRKKPYMCKSIDVDSMSDDELKNVLFKYNNDYSYTEFHYRPNCQLDPWEESHSPKSRFLKVCVNVFDMKNKTSS
jgi:hypothetical protein